MRWLPLDALCLLLAGCHLVVPYAPTASDGATGMRDARVDQARLADAAPDQAPADAAPDQGSADAGPDARVDAAAPRPLSAAELKRIFSQRLVTCGATQIPILEPSRPSLSLLEGRAVLATATKATLSWVGGQSSAVVLWDLNACGDEVPWSATDDDWASAGLLIRGASLTGAAELLLAAGTQLEDINLIDLTPSGTFESDPYLPDDSGGMPPDLWRSVLAAKQAVLAAAWP